ncbi:hypothetical protein HOLleu_35507 [Holothuria leucospilota]|uniref:Uncharacterized protein n=1 Tax=Holothuria leucospilota TaxID=206669 RepID=A0A9Q0YMS5_HOLLE|nr:hypothetical protein HOLleu_35507 [Holothuria leucospilota]
MATVSTEPCDIPQAQNPVDIPQDNLSSSPSSTQDVGSPGSSLAARRSRQTSLDYTLAERDALSQVAMDVSYFIFIPPPTK